MSRCRCMSEAALAALGHLTALAALRKGIQVLIQVSDYMGLRDYFNSAGHINRLQFLEFPRFVILKSNLL